MWIFCLWFLTYVFFLIFRVVSCLIFAFSFLNFQLCVVLCCPRSTHNANSRNWLVWAQNKYNFLSLSLQGRSTEWKWRFSLIYSWRLTCLFSATPKIIIFNLILNFPNLVMDVIFLALKTKSWKRNLSFAVQKKSFGAPPLLEPCARPYYLFASSSLCWISLLLLFLSNLTKLISWFGIQNLDVSGSSNNRVVWGPQ